MVLSPGVLEPIERPKSDPGEWPFSQLLEVFQDEQDLTREEERARQRDDRCGGTGGKGQGGHGVQGVASWLGPNDRRPRWEDRAYPEDR